MNKKSSAACLCGALVLLSGCGAAKTQEEALQKVTVGEVTVCFTPAVCMELGYFEEEGLTIDLVNLQGADKVMSALISDEIQIGVAGPEASVYVSNQNLENYAVNFLPQPTQPGAPVGRKQFSFDQLQQAEVLGGRKGGMPEMTLEYVLKTNGLDVGVDDVTKQSVRTDIQFAAMAGAFLSGDGDYVTLFEPTATQLEQARLIL